MDLLLQVISGLVHVGQLLLDLGRFVVVVSEELVAEHLEGLESASASVDLRTMLLRRDERQGVHAEEDGGGELRRRKNQEGGKIEEEELRRKKN